MFKPKEKIVSDRTPDNDPDIETLFRGNKNVSTDARKEFQQLNKLVCMFSEKYHINDVWGRTYKSDPEKLSLRFPYNTLNGMDNKHPIVKLMDAMQIQQDREQGDCSHLKYSIFTFNANQCNTLLELVELMNPTAAELEKLSDHEARHQVLC